MTNRLFSLKFLILCFINAGILYSQPVNDTQVPLIGDISDGSRAKPIHIIELFDADSARIRPTDQPVLPFSTKQTCLPCHNYETIRHGWHFNANDAHVPAGRPGHPWILTDRLSATQLPLSYREWPGVIHPNDIGLTPWYFVQTFGRQLPGGGVGEDDTSDVDMMYRRWMISGKLEINCLACHDAEPAHQQAEYAVATRNQNFRWAAAATSGFAHVTGSTKAMPDDYDIYLGVAKDDARSIPPGVEYDDHRFNLQGKVFVDLVRNVPNDRCLFCHSTKINEADNRWRTENDVHLASGLHCVDCHRNGLDHNMVRGDNASSDFSCEGCHLGNDASERGRLGAPRPGHTGIPTVHFDKLSCTACHSGPYATKRPQLVQTSMGHGLGTHGIVKADTVMPYIISPVYATASNGKIAPHNLVWPSFWGFMHGDSIQPILPVDVQMIVLHFIAADTLTDSLNYAQINSGQWPDLSTDKVTSILDSLTNADFVTGTPVFINNGKGYRVGSAGLKSFSHTMTAPYLWPIAHDVRPAQQSLGASSCSDCHSLRAGFNFGNVEATSPIQGVRPISLPMTRFQNSLGIYARLFAFTFLFRPLLKIFILICCLILLSTLVLYFFKGLNTISTVLSATRREGNR
ncbi:hypothetical protein JW960_21005 [candidate division KSB1 bacterium]|nr:hypothetical protein [candidate division KSB1 bacterium]